MPNTTYEIRLKPLSPVRQAFDATSLFGHLAWAQRYTSDKKEFSDWLQSFVRGTAPFLISSAFPTTYFPRPNIPEAHITDTKLRKTVRKLAFLPSNVFESLCQASSIDDMNKAIKDEVERREASNTSQDSSSFWRGHSQTRVAIDRQTGAAIDGQLFNSYSNVLDPKIETLSVFLRTDSEIQLEHVKGLLTLIGLMGIGGQSSIGLGAFELISSDKAPDFLQDKTSDYHISLAPVRPSADLVGYWKLRPYWGRLGGAYASQVVFKRPYLRIQHGALLARNAVGGMLDTTPPGEGNNPEQTIDAPVTIYDYLYSFPIACNLSNIPEG